MPFSDFIHSYAPDQLAKLTEAFDLTWPELLLAYRRVRSDHNKKARSPRYV